MKTTPHLFSRTYSGEGHTDTLFKLFGSKEDAIVAMNMQITADGWTPDQEHGKQTEMNKCFISEDECQIPRYQVIEVPDYQYLIVEYFQPNEVGVSGTSVYRDTLGQLVYEKEDWQWDEEPEHLFDADGDVNGLKGDRDSVYHHYEIIHNPFATKEYTEVMNTFCSKCEEDIQFTEVFPFCPSCLRCQH